MTVYYLTFHFQMLSLIVRFRNGRIL